MPGDVLVGQNCRSTESKVVKEEMERLLETLIAYKIEKGKLRKTLQQREVAIKAKIRFSVVL